MAETEEARTRAAMPRLASLPWQGYALATFLATAVEILVQSFRPLLAPASYLLFLTAIVVSALSGGTGPGLLALALASLSESVLPASLAFHSVGGKAASSTQLLVFSAMALILVWLASKVRHALRTLTTVVSNLGEGAVMTDARGAVVFLNAAGAALSGWKQKDALGKPFDKVVHLISGEKDRPAEESFSGVVSLGEKLELTNGTVLRPREGPLRQIEGVASPVRDRAGRVAGMMFVFHDIASQGKPQERYRDTQTGEALTRVAAGIAQDFNNSLTVITGQAELLRSRANASVDPQLRQSVDEIVRVCEQAATLSRELLAFSNLQAGHTPQAGAVQAEALAPEPKAHGTPNAATILVAERDQGVRTLMSSVLRENGYTVLEAAGGIEAASLAAENINRLDLIVADATLPIMGHRGLIERLSILRPELRILYVSAGGERLDPAQVQAKGRLRFLAKPFAPSTFLDKVRSSLDATG